MARLLPVVAGVATSLPGPFQLEGAVQQRLNSSVLSRRGQNPAFRDATPVWYIKLNLNGRCSLQMLSQHRSCIKEQTCNLMQ